MILAEIGKKIDVFESWLPEHLLNKAWPAQYRGVTALCEDWNDSQLSFTLMLQKSRWQIRLSKDAGVVSAAGFRYGLIIYLLKYILKVVRSGSSNPKSIGWLIK